MKLSALSREQGANRALFDRSVTPEGFELDFVDEPVLVKGFRRMVRGLEFDVAEMALTTYLTAKAHGVAFTALPLFLVRDFHHRAAQVLREHRGRPPAELAGGRIGINRGYTVTTGVWGRAALAEAGLDLDSVTWVRSGDEHVADYVPPGNVTEAPSGATLEAMLLAGDLDAVIGAEITHPDVVPLIENPDEVAADVLRARGVFPINHLIVVRDDLLAERPEVAPALFRAFSEAKRRYIAELPTLSTDVRQNRVLARAMEITGADPLPYGIQASALTVSTLIDHALRQHIIEHRPAVEDLFAESTWELQG